MNSAEVVDVVTLETATVRRAELAELLADKRRECDRVEGAYKEICGMCDYLQNIRTAIEEQKKAAGGHYSKQMEELTELCNAMDQDAKDE